LVPVKAVVFDLGGVLIDWDPRYLYRKLLADEAAVEEFLATVCTPEWNTEQDRGRPFAEGVAELVERHPEQAAAIAAYHERWPEMLGGDVSGAVELLAELRAAGVPLYALTNWSTETFVFARERFAFLEWFDGVLVSGEERLIKPDPAIFELLAERFGLDPRATFYVDDSAVNVTWRLGGCSLDPLPLPGHRLVGVVHDLGHGQLARPVAAGLEAGDDGGGELGPAAEQLALDPGQLGHLGRLGALGEVQLEQAEAADLEGLVGGLAQPGGERGPALGRDPVAAPPAPGLLPLLGQQPQAGQPLGLGVDLAVRELPEVGDAPADRRLDGVRGRGAVPVHQAEDDVGHGGQIGS
jgi:2-haloacid dehalogenase